MIRTLANMGLVRVKKRKMITRLGRLMWNKVEGVTSLCNIQRSIPEPELRRLSCTWLYALLVYAYPTLTKPF